MQRDEAASQAAINRLEPLVGEWSMGARFPRLGATGVAGRAVFEPVLDGQFLIQRMEISHPVPDSIAFIGFQPDAGNYTQHYFDSRGVARTYEMSFGEGLWKLTRDSPDFSPLDFSQRFIGAFDDDGRIIRGNWETSPDGSNWEHDFELTYSKVG